MQKAARPPPSLPQLFAALPELLELGDGHTRVTARFVEGRLKLEVRIAHFKIAATDLDQPPEVLHSPVVSSEAQEVLETLAELLHRVEGKTEIVAEYQDRKLRAVDHIIELEVVPRPRR